MLSFFRRIRKSLLNEGKTGRYFKYAIGEILLVVIGILIALQINNWNEKQKIKAKIETLLDKVENDVIANIKSSNGMIAFSKSYMTMINKVKNKQVTAEDYRNNFDYHQILFNYSKVRNNFENMVKLLQLEEDIPHTHESIIKQIKRVYGRKDYVEIAWEDMKNAFRKNTDWVTDSGNDFIFRRDKESIEKAIAFYLSDEGYQNQISNQAIHFNQLLFESRVNRVSLLAVLAEIKSIRDQYDKEQLITLFKDFGMNNYKNIGCDATKESYADVQGSRQSPMIINMSQKSLSMTLRDKHDNLLDKRDIPIGTTYIHDNWRGGLFNGGDYSKVMTFYDGDQCVAKMSEQDNAYIILDGTE